MKVYYMTDNTGFPVNKGHITWSPVEVVNGYAITKSEAIKEILDELELEYVEVDNEQILRYEFVFNEEGDATDRIIPDVDRSNYYNG